MPETFTATIGGDTIAEDPLPLHLGRRLAASVGCSVVPTAHLDLVTDVLAAYQQRTADDETFQRIANDEARRLRAGLAELEQMAIDGAKFHARPLIEAHLAYIADAARALLDGAA